MLKTKEVGKLPRSTDEGTWKTLNYENVNPGHSRVVNQVDNRFLITDGYFNYLISRIKGVVLTIIEASTEDKEKREAIKSLARRLIWNETVDVSLLKLEKVK